MLETAEGERGRLTFYKEEKNRGGRYRKKRKTRSYTTEQKERNEMLSAAQRDTWTRLLTTCVRFAEVLNKENLSSCAGRTLWAQASSSHVVS